jgi:hypothetical protein
MLDAMPSSLARAVFSQLFIPSVWVTTHCALKGSTEMAFRSDASLVESGLSELDMLREMPMVLLDERFSVLSG